MEEYESKIYIIPENIGESGGLSSTSTILKPKNLIEAVALLIVLAVVWRISTFAFGPTVKLISFALICLPLPVLAIFGIGDRSLIERVIEIIAFHYKKRKMIFKIPRIEKGK